MTNYTEQTPSELNDLVVNLQMKRDMYKLMKESYEKAKEDWEIRNQALIESYTLAKQSLAEVEEKLRTYAESIYDGENKKIGFGVRIQDSSIMDYKSEDAFAWAKAHNMCLKLDDAAFKKIAKAQKIDFVTYDTKPKATLPTVLLFE